MGRVPWEGLSHSPSCGWKRGLGDGQGQGGNPKLRKIRKDCRHTQKL